MTTPLRKKHLTALTKLLHLSILRKERPRALECFSLLARTKGVDLREIWSLGLEALGPQEEKAKEEFLEWLIVEYPVRANRTNRLRVSHGTSCTTLTVHALTPRNIGRHILSSTTIV